MSTLGKRAAALWLLCVAAGWSPVARAQADQKTASLDEILKHADNNAPAVLAARARLALGAAEVEASSPLFPENPELEIAAGPRLSSAGQGLELEVALRQRLEIAGQRGLRRKAAELGRERYAIALEQARWQMHRDLHATFHAALVARERVRKARQLAAFSLRLQAITAKREAAGAVSMLEVKVAQGEAARARQSQVKAEAEYRAIRMTLAERAGWPESHLPAPRGDLHHPRKAPPVAGLVKRALARHPGLRGQEARVREAEARADLARREVFPNPEVGVSYSREAEAAGEVNHIVIGSIGLPIPVWRRNQGERARALAQATVARADRALLRRALRLRVARTAAALDAAAGRVLAYGADVLPAFAQNLQMIERAYEAGKVDVVEVMVTRERFLSIQQDTLAAYEDYYRAHTELESLVGARIWPSVRGQEVAP